MATIACGNKIHNDSKAALGGAHHRNAVEVRDCFANMLGVETLEEGEYYDQQAKAEYEAEQANERWFEERGGFGPNEIEEARMGLSLGQLSPLELAFPA